MDVAGMAQDVFEFVGGENVVALGGRLESGPAQEHVGRAVEHVDKGEEGVVKSDERCGDPKRDGTGALDGKRLRGEFAEDDVQECDGGKGDAEGDGVAQTLAVHPPVLQQGFQPMGQEGFAQPAEAEAGQGDAELGGGEAGVEVVDRAQGHGHAPVAGFKKRLELAGADFDDGKLRRDEEAVGRDKQQDDKKLPPQIK